MDQFKIVDGEVVPLTEEDLAQRAKDLAEYEAELAAQQVHLLDRYMQEFRDMRRELLNVLAGIALAEDLLPDFRILRQALLDIPEVESVANSTTVEQVKRAVKAEYARIVSTAPAALVAAFKETQA